MVYKGYCDWHMQVVGRDINETTDQVRDAKIINCDINSHRKPHTHKSCDIKKQNTLSGGFTFW